MTWHKTNAAEPLTPIARWEWLLISALVVLMLAQMWTSIRQLSVTSDEIDHLHAGYRYLQCNDFGWNPEHPPLVKIVAALPLLAMHINDPFPNPCGLQNSKAIDFQMGHDFVFANPESMLTAARMASSSFAVLLLVLVWLFTRAMFGPATAAVAVGLTAFEPNFLAHGPLVTTDVAAAAGILLAVYACYLYVRHPSPMRVIALGAATGFAFSVKHSTIVLAAILPLLLLVDALAQPRDSRRPLLKKYLVALFATAAIALTFLWATYGFRYAARSGNGIPWIPIAGQRPPSLVVTQLIPATERWHMLPQAYLVGLQDIVLASERGRYAFLLGHVYRGGRWSYFPVAAAIRLTIPLLLLLLLSLAAVRFWRSRGRELLFVVTPLLLVFVPATISNLNIGFRHVLPTVPFALIFGAAGTLAIMKTARWRLVALASVLLFHVATSVRSFPNYLAYSNELWGGPEHTYEYLANSDVDWGQAQKMARDYIAETHTVSCLFIRPFTQSNDDYAIHCGQVTEIAADEVPTNFTGTVIVSSSVVDGIVDSEGGIRAARAFRRLRPVKKLGGSALLVYEGTFDLSPIASAVLMHRLPENATPELVIGQAQLAAAADPGDPDPHMAMCGRYAQLNDFPDAQRECNIGMRLILADSDDTLNQRERALRFLNNLHIPIEPANQAALQRSSGR